MRHRRLIAVLAATAASLAVAPAAPAAIVYVKHPTSVRPQVWSAHDDGTHRRRIGHGTQPALSPDGRWVAWQDAVHGRVLVRKLHGRNVRRVARSSVISALRFSPDSQRLGMVLRGRLVLHDLASHRSRTVARGAVNGFSFSPDATALVYGSAGSDGSLGAPSDLYTLDLASGVKARITRDRRSLNPLWGPAGEIVFDRQTQRPHDAPSYNLFALHPDGGALRRVTALRIPSLLWGLVPLEFSGDGTRLLAQFGGQDTLVGFTVNPRTGRARALSKAMENGFVAARLSRDGRTVLGMTGGPDPGNRHDVVTMPYRGGRATVLVRRAAYPDWSARPPVARVTRVITGNQGANTLRGSNGPDVIDGEGGSDRILGRGGADRLNGGTGGDRVDGGAGDDAIDGGSGDDDLQGGSGHDAILGGFGHDRIAGGSGNDTVDGGEAHDEIDGGPGDDTLHGGSAGDDVRGGDGDDVIYADSGPDTIDAGPGDDTVFANEGRVRSVDCGPGEDTVYFAPEGSIRPHPGCEHVRRAEPVPDPTEGISWTAPARGATRHGTERNDTLLGQGGPDRLYGEGGDDVLWADARHDGASGARDRLDGGAGNDTLYGGRGFSRLLGGSGDDYLQGGTGPARLVGGAGADSIRVRSGGRNTVSAGPGDDAVVAVITRGSARVRCGSGRDVVTVSRWNGNRRRVQVASDCERVRRG